MERPSGWVRAWPPTDTGSGSTWLLVFLPFATGVGLVINILTGFSLVVSVVGLATVGLLGFTAYFYQLTASARRSLLRRIGLGALAALNATVFYDMSRLFVASTFNSSTDPFAAWPVFGVLIIGSNHGDVLTLGAGYAFHLTNGVGFGIAYVLLVRNPGFISGILWALGLELAMALLYPSWLKIEALQEFYTLSVVGHVVYGATLGSTARWLLRRPPINARNQR